ncbi:MAG TPA: Fe-S cluster assembly protein SufE [Gammaproteobacteria bacterium]|nr:Fe-S cluster assembly protein SufE [Gammaproteobacteria bacterium]
MSNPFGNTITPEAVIDTLGFFDDWEERYRYIIDLGKELPSMPEELHTEDREIKGCQSHVWIEPSVVEGRLCFAVDSDAHVVRGLLAVVLAAVNNKSASDILAFDMEAYFQKIDLLKHLSPTRGNGLRAMVERVRQVAQEAMHRAGARQSLAEEPLVS